MEISLVTTSLASDNRRGGLGYAELRMVSWDVPESPLEVTEWAVCGVDGNRPPSAAASPPARGLTWAALLLLPLEAEAEAAASIVKGALTGVLCSVRGSSGGDGVSGMREEAPTVAGMAGVGGEKEVVDAVEMAVRTRDEDRDGGSGAGMAGVGTVSGSTVSVCGNEIRARVLRSSVA